MFGPMCANIDLHEIVGEKANQFATARLEGARYALCSEPDPKDIREHVHKKISGGDIMKSERKYHTAYEFKPTHTLIIATNVEPDLRDPSSALMRRIHYFLFPNTFKDSVDHTVEPRMLEGKVGILNWLLDGYDAWKAAGTLVRPPSAVELMTEKADDHDLLGEFFEQCCQEALPSEFAPSETVFEVYSRFCQLRNMFPGHYQRFVQSLKKRYPFLKSGRMKFGKVTRRVLRGITLKTTEESFGRVADDKIKKYTESTQN
jgi:P4 family phage/plasmid primase-like protien